MRSDLSQKTRNKLDNQIYSFFFKAQLEKNQLFYLDNTFLQYLCTIKVYYLSYIVFLKTNRNNWYGSYLYQFHRK